MGSLVSDFPGLPADDAPNRTQSYAGVYADLQRLAIARPAQPSDKITRAELLAHLQAAAGAIIKDEITSDPEGLGLFVAPDATKRTLLNGGYLVAVAKPLPGQNEASLSQPPRVFQRLLGFPYAPNSLTLADVTAARS